jgi:hypothetical protein
LKSDYEFCGKKIEGIAPSFNDNSPKAIKK